MRVKDARQTFVGVWVRRLVEGGPFEVWGGGQLRDFTYVDDIVEGIVRLMVQPAEGDSTWSAAHPDPSRSRAPYRVFNIGNTQPVALLRFIEILEEALGKKATKVLLPMQAGDVPATFADVEDLETAVGFRPDTSIEEGVGRFVSWYLDFYRIRVGEPGRSISKKS